MKDIVQLMLRGAIPHTWGRRFVTLAPEERMSVEFADRLRALTLDGSLKCTWLHIPNEGKRSQLVAIITKAMGMIAGAGDFVLTWSDGSGYIELKVKPNKQTVNQKYFETWCKMNGVKYVVVYSADEALSVVESWGLIV